MRNRTIVRPEAEQDLKEAFRWYEETRRGLGYDFLLQVHAGINLIETNPTIFQIEYKNVRKHLIKRFPFKIIYLFSENVVKVLAVIHTKRNPALTRDRIDKL